MPRLSWQAVAETSAGTPVRFHEIDRAGGFLHGYMDGIQTPYVWALNDGQILCGQSKPEYNLNLDTFQNLE